MCGFMWFLLMHPYPSKEIYLDVAWTAWQQVLGDERRQREMPKAQGTAQGRWLPVGVPTVPYRSM